MTLHQYASAEPDVAVATVSHSEGAAPEAVSQREVHRTAVFAVHKPTRHVRAVLERAFCVYTDAYTALLHACARYSLDELRGMATFVALTPTGAGIAGPESAARWVPRTHTHGRAFAPLMFCRPHA